MSYSFNVRGATKGEALQKVSAELEKVASAQPVHEADISEAERAAAAYIKLLAEDETKDVTVSMSGSIMNSESGISQVSFNINVYMANK